MTTTAAATSRLLLRTWRPEDLPAFAVMNADPRVMEYYPAVLDREHSDAVAARIQKNLAERGFGLWAVEVPGVADFIGFVGLSVPTFETAFTPCVEVGWRLGHEFWGRGYATEAASEALKLGFERFGLKEILSWTATRNVRSQAVMQRLGMERCPDLDFDHPMLSVGHPLRAHVVYRLAAPATVG